MAEYLIQDTTLDEIADAINAKTGGSSAMTPAEMVTAIGTISGGGNPNSVQVIEGTVDQPFGLNDEVNLRELNAALRSGNASATMRMYLEGQVDDTVIFVADGNAEELQATNANVGESAEDSYAWEIVYRLNPDSSINECNISFVRYWSSGTILNYTDYATVVATTLTIYWHSMPSGS